MRACQIQSAGACWLRASLRTAPSSRLSCGALALTCLGITLLLPLRNTPTSYCSPFEERSTKLAESEVITMEVVEAYLLISQDRALYEYYRRHYAHFFPALSQLHRSSFVRQAANWWALKELCWLLGLSVLKEAL